MTTTQAPTKPIANRPDIAGLTKAPLRMRMTTPVSSPPEKALSVVTTLDRIVEYLSSIKAAEIKYSSQGEPEARFCTVSGMGQVKESIVWYDEDLGYAYSADAPGLPMKDHLGIALVKPDGKGGSIITWDSYFNWKGMLKPVMMKLMFPGMMKSLGKGLQGDLGAGGPVTTQWM